MNEKYLLIKNKMEKKQATKLPIQEEIYRHLWLDLGVKNIGYDTDGVLFSSVPKGKKWTFQNLCQNIEKDLIRYYGEVDTDSGKFKSYKMEVQNNGIKEGVRIDPGKSKIEYAPNFIKIKKIQYN